MRTDRRAFLRRAPLVGLGVAAIQKLVGADGPGEPEQEDKERVPIALQLYSVRDDCARDFAGTVQAVAEMGYEGVEFAGYYGWSAEDLRKLLDDCGLRTAGAHIGLDSLLGDQFEPTVEFHATLGNRYLIVPGLGGERTSSPDAWRGTAEVFNELAARLEPYDMQTGYHNHSAEFIPFENGELPWDIFFGNTVQAVVMQFDTGNALHAGAEAVPFLRRYPGRAATIHCKEYGAEGQQAVLGEGVVPWAEVFEVCETIGGTKWYIVEQETYPDPPLECARKCLESLRRMGKIA